MYIPAGRSGNVTVDPRTHVAYVFTPEFGPAPATPADTVRPRGRTPRGPIVASWLIAIKH